MRGVVIRDWRIGREWNRLSKHNMHTGKSLHQQLYQTQTSSTPAAHPVGCSPKHNLRSTPRRPVTPHRTCTGTCTCPRLHRHPLSRSVSPTTPSSTAPPPTPTPTPTHLCPGRRAGFKTPTAGPHGVRGVRAGTARCPHGPHRRGRGGLGGRESAPMMGSGHPPGVHPPPPTSTYTCAWSATTTTTTSRPGMTSVTSALAVGVALTLARVDRRGCTGGESGSTPIAGWARARGDHRRPAPAPAAAAGIGRELAASGSSRAIAVAASNPWPFSARASLESPLFKFPNFVSPSPRVALLSRGRRCRWAQVGCCRASAPSVLVCPARCRLPVRTTPR